MKQLKYNSPIITSSPTIATLFSIISNENFSENWICNNFNNLLYIKNSHENRCIFFEDQPAIKETIFSEINFFKYNKIDAEILKILSINIVDFLKEMINHEYYIRIAIDHYYFSLNNYAYRSQHLMHPITIYGYDDLNKTFIIGEFLNQKKYQLYNIGYKEITQGFYFSNYPKEEEYEYLKNIVLINKISNYRKEQINISKIVCETLDYLYSCDSSKKYQYRIRKIDSLFFYGIDSYNQLIQSIISQKVDIRAAHVIYDRMKILSYKLDILYKNSLLSLSHYKTLKEKARVLCDLSLKCRNVLLKKIIKNNSIILLHKDQNTISSYYNELREKESNYLNDFLNILNSI